VPTPLHHRSRPSEQRFLVSFFELFQPGLKYLREEKDRQKILVAKPSHGGGAPLGIDLDVGTAKITIAPKPDRDHDQLGRREPQP
jgi:Family of unknown function (DUF6191)